MDVTWKDQLGACLPSWKWLLCGNSARPADSDDEDLERGPELDGLLFNSQHDATDVEADAMSLHSNVGTSSRRTNRKKKTKKRGQNGATKTVRVFGFDLFGRPQLPTPSPTHSDDEESSALVPSSSSGRRTRHISTTSSTSLDPDAAPLRDADIASLSSPPNSRIPLPSSPPNWAAPMTDEQIAREEEEQREKEERRARRRARKLKKQAEAEATAERAAGGFESGDDASRGFEGFPGGNEILALSAPLGSSSSHAFRDEDDFGGFVDVQRGGPEDSNHLDSEDEADAGGEYNRRSRPSIHSGSGGGSSSNSRSYTRGSASNSASGSAHPSRPRRSQHHPSHLNILQQQQAPSHIQPHSIPLPPSSAGSYRSADYDIHNHSMSNFDLSVTPTKKSKSSKKGRTSAARSQSSVSASTAPSTSIASPTTDSFSNLSHVSHTRRSDQGQDESNPTFDTSFPSTGFGRSSARTPGTKAGRAGLSGAHGAALARIGDL